MGASRWEESSYRSYAASTKHETLSREQLFTSRNMPQALDPAKIVLRESCDSLQNPVSTPIIIGLDVTGSMGFVAEEIAKKGLVKFMGDVYEQKPIQDPHLMFMGIGDVYCDSAPLQVSQFEADIRILEQLRELWLEKGGGGNDSESYDLPWYFAAHKTSLDCYNKRNQKGYLFTIGDEMPPSTTLSDRDLSRVFGSNSKNLPKAGSTKELLETAGEKFKIFHILAEEGSYARNRLQKVRSAWRDLMGPNVIFMKDCTKLPLIITSTLRIANGEDMEQVIRDSGDPVTLTYAYDITDY